MKTMSVGRIALILTFSRSREKEQAADDCWAMGRSGVYGSNGCNNEQMRHLSRALSPIALQWRRKRKRGLARRLGQRVASVSGPMCGRMKTMSGGRIALILTFSRSREKEQAADGCWTMGRSGVYGSNGCNNEQMRRLSPALSPIALQWRRGGQRLSIARHGQEIANAPVIARNSVKTKLDTAIALILTFSRSREKEQAADGCGTSGSVGAHGRNWHSETFSKSRI